MLAFRWLYVVLGTSLTIYARETHINDGSPTGASSAAVTTSAPSRTASAKPLEQYNLRILPMGDSITWGVGSTSGDGYRDVLYNDLSSGNVVDLVGTKQHGTMNDNYNDGLPGYRIGQIALVANVSLAENPDIVLLHAGTNDCIQGYQLDTAPERLGDLIDQILAIVPKATLLVAQIIGTSNSRVQANIDAFNAQVPGVVNQRASAGSHVLAVDMSQLLDTSTDYFNEWHPNDQGYVLMGNAWYQGLEQTNAMAWIHNATGGNISVTENSSMTATLPASLSDGAAPSTTTASSSTSSAGAPRLAAMPMSMLFALPGNLISMAMPTIR